MKLKSKNAERTVVEKAKSGVGQVLYTLFGVTGGLDKMRDVVKNNFELGVNHLKLGNLKDAIMRFRLVVWLDPKHAGAWYHLGRAYLADGRRQQAQDALKKSLGLTPGHEEAAYMLALALGPKTSPDQLPARIPPKLLLDYFDTFAADYDRTELEQYKYQGHTLLASAVRAAAQPGRIDHVVLDVGCGTGLAAPPLRDISAHITGVDFSQPMLTRAMERKDAQGKKIYDALIHREALEFLQAAADGSFDIVLAAQIFSYVGRLEPFYREISRVVKPGGLFAFSADRLEGEGWQFDTGLGRFRFSQPYLRQLASLNGFTEIRCDEAPVYPPTKTWLCVLRK